MAEHGMSSRLTDIQSSHVLDVPTFEGYGWSSLQPCDLKNLWEDFCILDTAFLKIPALGCVDEEGFSDKVALTMCALTHELRLPFCHPLHNILDLLLIAPTQLHPYA